jgi:3-oxoacyl-[acyl-carrier protein] reductase
MIAIDLTNKTAFVTGASRGLGLAIASTLHSAGANVVVNYFDDDDEGETNRVDADSLVEALGDRAVAIGADVRDRRELEAAMDQTIARFGSLDIVVANAGILRDRTIIKMTDDQWQAVIDTNLTGVYNTTKAAATRISDGGRIINIASLAAVIGIYGQANYASAKAGVMALTRVTSRELARRNITANAVAPGVVMTEMGHSIPEQNRNAMLAQIPLGRFGQPEEVANTVLFLASSLSSYISGQTIHVNGGWWG